MRIEDRIAEIIHENVYEVNDEERGRWLWAIDPDDLISELLSLFSTENNGECCMCFDEERFIEMCGGFYNS